ncbi:MAG: glycosyltransferase, partial [Coriobacteriales bacterium]|nr:glycosyltransferase [Coriobacteriales bacterium]
AKGRWLAVLESDDFALPKMLELLYNAAIKHQVQVVKGNCWFYWSGNKLKDASELKNASDVKVFSELKDASGAKVASELKGASGVKDKKTRRSRERKKFVSLVPRKQTGYVLAPLSGKIKDTEIFFLPPSIWSGLYEVEFLRNNNIRFLETPGASYQDTSFNFKVWVLASKVNFISEAVLYYRQDNESSSMNSKAKADAVVTEFSEMKRFIQASANDAFQAQDKSKPELTLTLDNERLSLLLAVLRKMQFDTYLWNYERLKSDLQLTFLKFFAKEFQETCDMHAKEELLFFEEWKAKDMQLIVADPDNYHRLRSAAGQYSQKGKLVHYYRLGGLRLLLKILRSKL